MTGPTYEYFRKVAKTWLVVSECLLAEAKTEFADTDVNITTGGRCELGAPIGTQSFVESYVERKVEEWVAELDCLCRIARSQPQAAYCAFCHGFGGKWLYITRTVPGISPLMRPLEEKSRQSFIPIITMQSAPVDTTRTLLSLPVRLGGLSLTDPMTVADTEYEASVRLTAPLAALIVLHEKTLGESCHQHRLIKKEISYEKRKQVNSPRRRHLRSYR